MDTINATILDIRKHENRFLIALEYQVPEGAALIRVCEAAAIGADPVVKFGSYLPGEPLQVTATTLGAPALKIGDILAIQVFYGNEASRSQPRQKNVIFDMLQARVTRARTAEEDAKRSERIKLIYSLADSDTRRWLDVLITEICNESLQDLLKYYDEPK